MSWSIKDTMSLILPFIIGVFLLSPTPSDARALTSLELIEKAYRNGEIDYSEALNHKVAAVLKIERLPEGYRSKVFIKSATPVIMEARLNRHLLSPENARLLARGRVDTITELYGSGIELLSFVSPKRRFRIHYTIDNKNGDAVPTTDENENRLPDYVERFADILDHVWTREIDEMGYDAPPSDGNLGGDCLLDVYLADLPGYYGYTWIDKGMSVSTVYMIFENDYSGFPSNSNPGGQQEGDMEVTAAHEFFHTIQLQLTDNIDIYGWWMEASATWMEDYVYPGVNDYVNYIADWFKHPELSLDTFDGRFEYGNAVWIKHMTEKYGSKFVYDVWNRIKDSDSALSGVEKVLLDRNTTLEEELKELRVANVTLTYADGQIYQTWDGTNPAAVTYDKSYTDFSGTENIPNVGYVGVDRLASKYYSFSAPKGTGSLNIDFNGNGNMSVMVIGFRSTGTGYDATEMITNGENDGSITISGFSSNGPYSRAVVIPLNYSTTYPSSFNLTASYSATIPNNATPIEIRPASTSIVAEDAVSGKQQYFPILKDGFGNQVLESVETWASDTLAVAIDSNGLATVSDAVGATLTASLRGRSTSATLSGDNPVKMTPGAPRNCIIRHSDGRCFIATAAFGSPLHPYVEILREFRDRYLVTNSFGSKMVSLYYFYSPSIAVKIAEHTYLRVTVKLFLIPAIIFSVFMVKTTLFEKVIVGILFIIIGVITIQQSGSRSSRRL